MRSATVSKWLQENANAPPPPATPAGLPDDSVSTVYPESSVSNPYASRYTGSRHRTQHPMVYLDRRPTSAQGHRNDREVYHYQNFPQRHRHQSFSVDERFPTQTKTQPYTYAYAQPQSMRNMYYSSQPTQSGYTRVVPQRSQSISRYNLATSRSPTRADVVRPQQVRGFTTYANYASTPSIPFQPRPVPTKKAPLLRRLFGIEWGSSKTATPPPPRHSSRSSSKSKSYRSESKSYETYRPTTRGRSNSEGIVYLRY